MSATTYEVRDVLLRAARLIRERAQAATPGPWGDPTEVRYGEFGWSVSGCPAGETEDSEQGQADATWIASMHPAVGLALAELLDAAADRAARAFTLLWNSRAPKARPDQWSAIGKRCREEAARTVAAELAIARAYLGEVSLQGALGRAIDRSRQAGRPVQVGHPTEDPGDEPMPCRAVDIDGVPVLVNAPPTAELADEERAAIADFAELLRASQQARTERAVS